MPMSSLLTSFLPALDMANDGPDTGWIQSISLIHTALNTMFFAPMPGDIGIM